MNDCIHLDFLAEATVARMFREDVTEEQAKTRQPDSVAIEIRVCCVTCGKQVRFEGPVGMAVGSGSGPMVSFDGTEVRIPGHLGENLTPPITVYGPVRTW